MKSSIPKAWLPAVVCLLALSSVPCWAEVTRVDVERREDVLGGAAFGAAGPYEKIIGKVHFAVDPSNPRNTIIVDLDRAPKNAQGAVEFSADLYVLKPKDPARGNGVVLFDIVNRGNKALLRVFSRGGGSVDPTSEADFGDAYLLRQGYTLVMVGWQFDVPKGTGRVGFDPPIATENGQSISGWVRMWFLSNEAVPSMPYIGGYNTPAYPPLDPQNPEYRLTVREKVFAPARVIPRDEWQFARMENGRVVSDVNSIYLKSGLKAGWTYEVAYETENPPVAGLGMAAIRDMASKLKHDPGSIAPGRYAYMYGASQTGRLIRQLVYDGFTIDEQERKAFDGIFVQTGATSRGSFNERFALPNEVGSFNQTKFPILYTTTTDPVTGRREGLGMRIPAGLEPKIMLVDSSSEYWDRGRVAALRHLSIDGTEDLEDAPNVRVYMLAGTRHGAGSLPPADRGGQFKENTNNYTWAQRGLLAALDGWVREGTEPPPSSHPRLVDGTLVAQSEITFPDVPGVQWPLNVPGGYRADVPGSDSALPFFVPNVDADGNDTSGIRLPELAVPLATLTGWQFRSERIGLPHVLVSLAGAYIPFAKTRAERERSGDPRLSIAERYSSRADYLTKIEASARSLAAERYILTEDVEPIVEAAGQHWDYAMGSSTPSGQGAP